MVVQGAIGYMQYFSHLPALLVGVHVFGATMVWMAMLWFYDGLWHHEPERVPHVGHGRRRTRDGAARGRAPARRADRDGPDRPGDPDRAGRGRPARTAARTSPPTGRGWSSSGTTRST